MHVSLIDWIIIATYLTGCMAAGIWMRRFVHGVEDFAIAGRAMDLNLGIASLAATELGLVTVMYTAQLGVEFLVHVTGIPKGSHTLEWTMTILLGLVLLYTVLGGMLSVLITDYLQFIVMGLGIVVTSILVIKDIGWYALLNKLWICWDGTGVGVGQTLKAHPFNPLGTGNF